MRLWSLHPKYLDSQGLVAVWREGLLARKVLAGQTRGYKTHPQLERFKKHEEPVKALDAYLFEVWKESRRRGYSFNRKKIGNVISSQKLAITTGQLTYELQHLRKKLERRDRNKHKELEGIGIPHPHPFFKARPGAAEKWERIRQR